MGRKIQRQRRSDRLGNVVYGQFDQITAPKGKIIDQQTGDSIPIRLNIQNKLHTESIPKRKKHVKKLSKADYINKWSVNIILVLTLAIAGVITYRTMSTLFKGKPVKIHEILRVSGLPQSSLERR